MKKFKNYTFEFDKNEKRILVNFAKQALKQMEGDNKYFAEIRVYNSLIEKLNSSDDNVKLTKDEYTRISFQLKENVKFIKQKIDKSWFLKKWLYKSIYTQYTSLLNTHFSD